MGKIQPTNINEVILYQICSEICSQLPDFCNCLNKNSKKDCISSFQDKLCVFLNQKFQNRKNTWQKEYKKPRSPYKDRIDIFGSPKSGFNWIIEIDASRADQVAKKAFSRFALFGSDRKATPFFYVAIVYPGTDNMSISEVIKYSRYGHAIAKKMNKNNEWRTIIIDCKHNCVKVINFNNLKFMVNGNGAFRMGSAVEEAIKEYFKQSKNRSYSLLSKYLQAYNGNHNGLQTIISEKPLTKNPIMMQDGTGSKFYLTTQWSFLGESCNFDEIVNFFKKYNIIIEPVWQAPCDCL